MKQIIRLYFLLLVVSTLSLSSAHAQYSQIYSSADSYYIDGVELYSQGQFAASERILRQYHGKNYAHQAEFYLAANAFELRKKDADNRLKAYLSTHPYTPYASEVHFMLGVLQVERKKNKQALKEFEKVKDSDLFRPHQSDFLFYKGYAFLRMNEPQQASAAFARLKLEKSRYQLQAKYYYAFCQYTLQNYGKALPEFLAIEHTAAYKNVVPYYIIQIYYAQGQYDEVYERAEFLLSNDPENEYIGELHRMMGEISYQNQDYEKAIAHLTEYEKLYTEQNKTLQRQDIYLLAMAYYQTANFQKATEHFNKIRKDNDLLCQNTCYHTGSAYLKLGQIQQAKMAFAAAMRYQFDDQLREEAMYNYALTCYQSSSALGESVTAFTDFLQQYPDSKYREHIYELLGDVFLSSKNYTSALETLEQIENPNKKLQETKQYLRYQIGTDAFVQGNNDKAIEYFTYVIDTDKNITYSTNNLYPTECYFFRAEAKYRKKLYAEAQNDLNAFLHQKDAKKSKNYQLSNYSMGYVLFSQKQYKEALQYFLTYIQAAENTSTTYADALNRIGDCYFNARDFVNAENYYAKAIATGSTGADYATFQRGYALGLLKRYSDKITILDRLAKQYPKSDYADDALYEIARAELQRNNNKEAIQAYERLLTAYPNSNLARKAALEKSMIYYNQKNYTKAIEGYKQVIKNYPGSDEAYAALDGLETAYIETDNVAEYLAYTKNLGRINMKTDSKEDSLTYVAAERQYILQNYSQAVAGLSKYLSQYCTGGRYCTVAQYYVADSYYQLNQKSNAIEEYKKLADISGNPYMEEALIRVAEIAYDMQDYSLALTYFKRLQLTASSIEKINIARLGILRCSYYLNDNQTTINIASQIIEDISTSSEVMAEARYNRAKAYFEINEYDLAIADFTTISNEVRTKQGAEAKYMIAEAYFRLNDIDKAEEEIMAFASMNTQQQYWLAKSFLLLSDIYVKRGDDFQAKQYLLSLRSNYRTNDDIQPQLTQRLQSIEERETEKIDDTQTEE